MKNKPLIIIAGEPHSVFLEIYLKCFVKYKFKKPNILIVSKKLLLAQIKFFKYNLMVEMIDFNNIDFKNLSKNKINIIDVDLKFDKIFENISIKSNKYLKQCFKIALKLLKTKNFSGLINGPISKKHFLKGKFLGITEYLAKKNKKTENIAMLIFNQKLSVSPITTHLALKDVSKHISKKKIYSHVNLITNFYKKKFKRKPRIAITGLNPHCESNFRNSEEKTIIIPAIKNLIIKNFLVQGPFPADTIFMRQNLKNFDVVIGMYHDQVLSPMKTLFGFDAINITLGLPFIRITPDHGPNFSMLGKNLSNTESLMKALKFLDK